LRATATKVLTSFTGLLKQSLWSKNSLPRLRQTDRHTHTHFLSFWWAGSLFCFWIIFLRWALFIFFSEFFS
jgi:hypothetical protein